MPSKGPRDPHVPRGAAQDKNRIRVGPTGLYELFRNGKWFTSEELCNETGVSPTGMYKRFRRFLLYGNNIHRIWSKNRPKRISHASGVAYWDGEQFHVSAEKANKHYISRNWRAALCCPWRLTEEQRSKIPEFSQNTSGDAKC